MYVVYETEYGRVLVELTEKGEQLLKSVSNLKTEDITRQVIAADIMKRTKIRG